MKKNNGGIRILSILGGLGLLAVGAAIVISVMIKEKEMNAVMMVISGADALFGIILIISGFMNGAGREYAPDSLEDLDLPEQPQSAAGPAPEPATVSDAGDVPAEPMTAAELAAEEGRLRREAQEAAREAEETLREAKKANAEAKAAERELNAAEERAQQLIGPEQQQAFREVDRLAGVAEELAKKAAVAKKRAKVAAKASQIAEEKHARAIDAAAEAMGDDLDEEF